MECQRFSSPWKKSAFCFDFIDLPQPCNTVSSGTEAEEEQLDDNQLAKPCDTMSQYLPEGCSKQQSFYRSKLIFFILLPLASGPLDHYGLDRLVSLASPRRPFLAMSARDAWFCSRVDRRYALSDWSSAGPESPVKFLIDIMKRAEDLGHTASGSASPITRSMENLT